MSDVGKCYDNARMESFFATLKKKKIYLVNTKVMDMQEVKKPYWTMLIITIFQYS